MNPIILFAIIGTSTMTVLLPKIILHKIRIKRIQEQIEQIEREEHEPFIASEYLARIEQTSFEIAENQEPVGQTIILWWGLDGLRLNEDGSLEWISRKKPKPVNQDVFYQPYQSIQPISTVQTQMWPVINAQTKMCQCVPIDTRMQIAALQAQVDRMQCETQILAHNAAIYNQIFMTQIPYPAGYSPYTQPPYTSQMARCYYLYF